MIQPLTDPVNDELLVTRPTPATTSTPFGEETATELPLGDLLDAVVDHLRRFVFFASPHHAVAIALWVAHTHVDLDRLEQSPVLCLTSAVKQCGKSRLLDVIEHLVRSPWRTARPSEATLFRKIDASHPTLLLDEADAVFGDKAASTEGIRATFNIGNRHGTKVPRMVPKARGFELAEFDVFCPKATAGIGGLPDTILDRAIVIRMERRTKHDRVERLRDRQARALGAPLRNALAEQIARLEDLTLPDTSLPNELDERAQDGWEALLAIADAAGGRWPGLARDAAVSIHGARSPLDDNDELRALRDCHAVFSATPADFISSGDLLIRLLGLDGSPWAEIRGRELTAHRLGRLLRAFGISSARHRPSGAGNPIHGYFRASFADAWARYGVVEQSGTTDTTGTAGSAADAGNPAFVPLVPDVPGPDAGTATEEAVADYPGEWDLDAVDREEPIPTLILDGPWVRV